MIFIYCMNHIDVFYGEKKILQSHSAETFNNIFITGPQETFYIIIIVENRCVSVEFVFFIYCFIFFRVL